MPDKYLSPDSECFFIAPIGTDESEERKRSDGVFTFIISRAAEELGLVAVRADKIAQPGQITIQVLDHVLGARAAVADLTGKNPNVFYELAVRHTARLPTVLICDVSESLPFDIAQMRTVFFDHTDLGSADNCRRQIVAQLREAMDGAVDSPIATTIDYITLQGGNTVERSVAELVTSVEGLAKSQRDLSLLSERILVSLSTGPQFHKSQSSSESSAREQLRSDGGGSARASSNERLYVWPTAMMPHALINLCPSVQRRGEFFGAAEVVVFPSATESSGYRILSAERYLDTGENLDLEASAVRFNTGSTEEMNPFSLIWTPLVGGASAKGVVHALTRLAMVPIMEAMITQSATREVDVKGVLRDATELEGIDVPSTLRPPAETGLVKSRRVPGTNLRLVSRLSDELLASDSRIIHEVVIGAEVPDAIDEVAGLQCEVSVFPRGAVRMAASSPGSFEHTMTQPVAPRWGRPQDGRFGIGSRYVAEGLISYNEFVLEADSAKAGAGRLASVIRTRIRLLLNGEEICRLNHLFEIESHDKVSPFAQTVYRVIEVGMLGEYDAAQVAGVPAETVTAWMRDDQEPSGTEVTRVNELSAVVEQLANLIPADHIALWLRKPLRTLGDESPLDLLARGEYRKVSRLVAGIDAPVAS